jgi:hypothetical protein
MEVTMRFQIRIRDDGDYEVVDIRTGQTRYCGNSLFCARMAQAQLLAAEQRNRPPR